MKSVHYPAESQGRRVELVSGLSRRMLPASGNSSSLRTEGGNRGRHTTPRWLLAALAVSLALVGCGNQGTPIIPKIISFNYTVRTVPDASALIASVQGGQTTVTDLLSRGQCNFTADFSTRTPPQVFINGTPGQTGFNVNLVSTAPVGIATTNPSSCIALAEFEINIGGRSEALALGAQTSHTNGRVRLVDGSRFTTSEFFRAKVTSFDPANRRSIGEFSFIDRLSSGSNTVIIVDGSYALAP